MVRKLFFLAVALFLPALSQAQVKLLRHPTYSNGKVAFSYLGDLWIANENGSGVQRLTDNQARDVFPRFSPDGNWIAFSSNREGNYDVYVIPASGGKPRQLTFHSADDNVVNWTPDGKSIVFTSGRGNGIFPSVITLWEVPVAGGIERPVPTDWGAWASYSPDGSKMAFTRHPATWSRKHYRGSYAADLWVMDVAGKKFSRLGGEDYKGNRMWPMYARNGEIFYVSNQVDNEKGIKFGGPEVMKSVNNIWKISDKGGKETRVTNHGDGNLFFPSISADGKTIVYEDNFGLWKLDTASGKSSEIVIDIKVDPKENEKELVTLSEAQGFHISPSNKRAAVVAHGEIFTIATDRGEPQRVSETSWKEQDPRWSPNGKWIAFVSDRTGREELYLSDELGKTVKKISDADCDKSGIVWAARFQDSDVERQRPQAAHGGRGKREDRYRGAERCGQRHRRAVFAGRKVHLVFAAGQNAASACVGEGTGERAGAHDRRRGFPAIGRRALDARRQEAVADRRDRRAGDGRVEPDGHAALRGGAAAGGEGSRYERDQQ